MGEAYLVGKNGEVTKEILLKNDGQICSNILYHNYSARCTFGRYLNGKDGNFCTIYCLSNNVVFLRSIDIRYVIYYIGN